MSRKHSCRIGLVHVVTADPLIHLACDPEEVLDLLEDLSVPGEVLAVIAEDLAIKGLIVSALFREVEAGKSTTVAALAERLNGLEVEAPDLPAPSEILVDEETIAAIVAELRKRDVLAGTDQKVRMAGGKKRRQDKRRPARAPGPR